MGNNVFFFHVKNVHTGEDHTLKPGDEVTFIHDEYDKGVIDIQFFPTLFEFPSTSETVAQVESPNLKGTTPKSRLRQVLNSAQ